MKRSYDFKNARRGAVVPAGPGKTRITIRIDNKTLAWFKEQVHVAGGGNYQSLMNQALGEWIQTRREPLEQTLRRVLREELPTYRASGGRKR
ncbi:MAG TPA: BrnA antitoxin family protein [Dongiaceae bacterium]|nr:BrnA antitoxin family protein [Dongiaceae bacterium]